MGKKDWCKCEDLRVYFDLFTIRHLILIMSKTFLDESGYDHSHPFIPQTFINI